MNHGLMQGMFWGGVLLSSIPVSLGIGIAVYVFWRYRQERAARRAARAGPQPEEAS